MRFAVLEDIWALDALNPMEWHFLCELPDAAAGSGMDPAAVKNSLFPCPLADDTEMDSDLEQQIEDWNEYVQPEIESIFDEARKTVIRDLETAEKLPATEFFESDELEEITLPDSEPLDYRRVLIPLDHADAWYSALNQARLLMNEEHEITDSMERFSFLMGSEGELSPERGLLLAQYEMYSAIQSILVENLMK